MPQVPESVRPYMNWGNDFELASQLWKPHGGVLHRDAVLVFPAGGMFWARPAALAPLAQSITSLNELPPEPLPVDGTSLHAFERLVAHACETTGHRWRLLCESTEPLNTAAKTISVLEPQTEVFQQASALVAALCRDQQEQLEHSHKV